MGGINGFEIFHSETFAERDKKDNLNKVNGEKFKDLENDINVEIKVINNYILKYSKTLEKMEELITKRSSEVNQSSINERLERLNNRASKCTKTINKQSTYLGNKVKEFQKFDEKNEKMNKEYTTEQQEQIKTMQDKVNNLSIRITEINKVEIKPVQNHNFLELEIIDSSIESLRNNMNYIPPSKNAFFTISSKFGSPSYPGSEHNAAIISGLTHNR